MRLEKDIIEFIKTGLNQADAKSKIFLFGSRTDDHAKGGDIDVLWLTQSRIPKSQIRAFKVKFYKEFGWRQVDIVNFTFDENENFKELALDQAIAL